VQKLSVTPIGTCRINNPLRQAQSKYPIFLNTTGIYGFTHTSDEALQQLRFLQGDKIFQEQVRPIVFRAEAGHGSGADRWQPSDLQIVEISSAKKITSGDDSVQINYLYRHFADFFSSGSRTQRFWSLVKRRAMAELADFLETEPAYQMMTAEDRSLLTSLGMEQQDFASIKADMAEMVERLGRDALLFVTHVNARTPDGSTIPPREKVIHWVKLAAEQLDVPCFDPTDAMAAFGQERALEHGGLDLTHFTQAFSDRVYAEIHREHVGRMMELRPELAGEQDSAARQHLLADNIEALMRFDDFLVGTRRLYAALRKEPDAIPLIQLRGKILAQTGDFEGAVRDLENLDRSSSLSPEGRIALLEAYAGTEAWARAIELADELLGEEYESGVIYTCAATACERTGQLEAALGHWKQAFRHDRSDLNAALRTLALLSQLDQGDQLKAWREEVLEHSRSSTNGAFEIARWALEHRDEELFAKVFGAICEQDLHRAENLFDRLIPEDLFKAAAACLRILAGFKNETVARQLDKVAARSSKVAAELLADGLFNPAYDLADAAAQIRQDGIALRTRRAAMAHYRGIIREAYGRQDYPAVVEAWAAASDIVLHATDAALLAAVSLHKLERNADALELLLRIHDREPGNAAVLRWSGRIASLLSRYGTALPMYAALRQSQDPAAEKYRAEIARFFETAERRALKQLRSAIVDGQFALALDLAELLEPDIEDRDRLHSEVERLNRLLRIKLREIENGNSDDENRERVLLMLLRIKPDDAAILRRLALELMRQVRFQEAAELWSRLDRLSPGTETNMRNLEKCRILAARQHKSPVDRKLASAA
jgi:tetratricopeptide (TPR) repeat protein